MKISSSMEMPVDQSVLTPVPGASARRDPGRRKKSALVRATVPAFLKATRKGPGRRRIWLMITVMVWMVQPEGALSLAVPRGMDPAVQVKRSSGEPLLEVLKRRLSMKKAMDYFDEENREIDNMIGTDRAYSANQRKPGVRMGYDEASAVPAPTSTGSPMARNQIAIEPTTENAVYFSSIGYIPSHLDYHFLMMSWNLEALQAYIRSACQCSSPRTLFHQTEKKASAAKARAAPNNPLHPEEQVRLDKLLERTKWAKEALEEIDYACDLAWTKGQDIFNKVGASNVIHGTHAFEHPPRMEDVLEAIEPAVTKPISHRERQQVLNDHNAPAPRLNDMSERDKRALGTILATVGAAGVGWLLNSALSSSDNDHLVTQLNRDTNELKIQRRNSILFNETLKHVDKAVTQALDEAEIIQLVETCDRHTSAVLRHMETVELMIEDVLRNEVPIMALNQAQLKREWSNMRTALKEKNFKIALEDYTDLYRISTSYMLSEDYRLIVILNVPITSRDMMKLYERVDAPIILDFNTGYMVDIVTQNRYLAIGEKHKTYKEYGSLDGCEKIGRVYNCEHDGLIHKKSRESCLFALFKGRLSQIEEHCTFKPRNDTELTVRVHDGDYFFWSKDYMDLKLDCTDMTDVMGERRVKGAYRIRVGPGCSVQSEESIMYLSLEEWGKPVPDEVFIADDRFTERISKLAMNYTANRTEINLAEETRKKTQESMAEYLFKDVTLQNWHWLTIAVSVGLACGVLGMCCQYWVQPGTNCLSFLNIFNPFAWCATCMNICEKHSDVTEGRRDPRRGSFFGPLVSFATGRRYPESDEESIELTDRHRRREREAAWRASQQTESGEPWIVNGRFNVNKEARRRAREERERRERQIRESHEQRRRLLQDLAEIPSPPTTTESRETPQQNSPSLVPSAPHFVELLAEEGDGMNERIEWEKRAQHLRREARQKHQQHHKKRRSTRTSSWVTSLLPPKPKLMRRRDNDEVPKAWSTPGDQMAVIQEELRTVDEKRNFLREEKRKLLAGEPSKIKCKSIAGHMNDHPEQTGAPEARPSQGSRDSEVLAMTSPHQTKEIMTRERRRSHDDSEEVLSEGELNAQELQVYQRMLANRADPASRRYANPGRGDSLQRKLSFLRYQQDWALFEQGLGPNPDSAHAPQQTSKSGTVSFATCPEVERPPPADPRISNSEITFAELRRQIPLRMEAGSSDDEDHNVTRDKSLGR